MNGAKARIAGMCYGCGGVFYAGALITTAEVVKPIQGTVRVAYHWRCRPLQSPEPEQDPTDSAQGGKENANR